MNWFIIIAVAAAVFFAVKYFSTPEGQGELSDIQKMIKEHRENQRRESLKDELLQAFGVKRPSDSEIEALLTEHQTAEQRAAARVQLLKALGYDPSTEASAE